MANEPNEPSEPKTTEARINRAVIDIMTKYELFGLTSQLLLAINAFTKFVIEEKNAAYEDGKSMAEYDKIMTDVEEATDAVHEAYHTAIHNHISGALASEIIAEVVG